MGWPALCGAADNPASKPAPEKARAFISLLLPLSAPEFAKPAEAVMAGCSSALEVAGQPLALQISRTDATPASILANYQAAVERGAAVIVGPMTRDGVTALARSALPGTPTLTLNVPDFDAPLPDGFYTLSLSAESEARLVAQNAYASGLHTAAVVHGDAAWSRRVGAAFSAEWTALGGNVSESLTTGVDLTFVREQLAQSRAELVFLAADAAEARYTRPYLNNQLPVYAVSLVHGGQEDLLSGIDLNGIRFVDMPWLVQPDHPAVMVYPRPDAMSFELQRFYALGIDACRLAPLIASRRSSAEIDGVTGRLHLGARSVEREPVAAVFRDGAAVAVQADGPPR